MGARHWSTPWLTNLQIWKLRHFRDTGADIDAETIDYKLSEKEVKMPIDTLGRRDSENTVKKSGNMQPKAVVDTPGDTQAKMEAAQVWDKLVNLQSKVPVHTPAATITKVKAKTLSKHKRNNETLVIVVAETQCKQECKPKHLQTH